MSDPGPPAAPDPSLVSAPLDAPVPAQAEGAAAPDPETTHAHDVHAAHPLPADYADPHGHGHGGGGFRYELALGTAALGVVYGDIGTSPLYALKECFHALPVTPGNVLGILSLVFWSLVLVISLKYLAFVMRADNEGEGGILALMALAVRRTADAPPRRHRGVLVALGLFGAALLYGDGIITPAISVLSAVEGLNVATPVFAPYVLPITLVILVGLFLVQSKGTAGIGRVFGPVTLVWFTTLGVLGLLQVVRDPSVLAAVHPVHGVEFFLTNGQRGFFILGSVFLVVTGGEALYADMGHFGIRPIRRAWFVLVLPALLLCYFGQGALLLSRPETHENPLFHLVPEWGVIPLVVLATLATVIASQAVITGAFSLTMQGVQLGYLPRVRILHTSRTEYGQVYVPAVNTLLMLACLALVVGFRSSTNLAAAYGIAVTSTMAITSVLFYVVARERWGWNPLWLVPLILVFLAIDLAFFGANIVKVLDGGWVPLGLAAAVFVVMTTWYKGREILGARMAEGALPLDLAMPDVAARATRVSGTAVYMHGNPKMTPPALLHNLKHNKVLHDRVVFLRVEILGRSYVRPDERVAHEVLGEGFHRVTLRYGFAETPDVATALAGVPLGEPALSPMTTTFFLGRERIFSTDKPGMARWRERLFGAMTNNAANAADFFGIPPNQVIEIGARVEI